MSMEFNLHIFLKELKNSTNEEKVDIIEDIYSLFKVDNETKRIKIMCMKSLSYRIKSLKQKNNGISIMFFNTTYYSRLMQYTLTWIKRETVFKVNNLIRDDDCMRLDAEGITFRGERFPYTDYEEFLTFWDSEVEGINKTYFEGPLYHTQISSTIDINQRFQHNLEKPTFFCIKPELCVLATKHRRYSEVNPKRIWREMWWFTYQTKEPLQLLTFEMYVDEKFGTVTPEEVLINIAKERNYMGWKVKYKHDQLKTDFYEIAVFKEHMDKLDFKSKEKELDFFEKLYAEKLEVAIYKKIIRPVKDYKSEIKFLTKYAKDCKEEKDKLQHRIYRLENSSSDASDEGKQIEKKRKRVTFRFF